MNKFNINNAVKVLGGKYEGLAGIVTEIKQDEKTKKYKYKLHIEGVKDGDAVEADYWCDEENGEHLHGY